MKLIFLSKNFVLMALKNSLIKDIWQLCVLKNTKFMVLQLTLMKMNKTDEN